MRSFSLEDIIAALQASWDADTAFDDAEWSLDNPARGQCVVSCLVFQDFKGGELVRYKVTGDVTEKHYANRLPDGTIVDTSGAQYSGKYITLQPDEGSLGAFGSRREKLLAGGTTMQRYELLKSRVSEKLGIAGF